MISFQSPPSSPSPSKVLLGIYILASIPSSVLSNVFFESTPCLNNYDYTYNGMTCKKIRFQEDRRQENCKVAEVATNCPQTCGYCCEDDPDFVFPMIIDSTRFQPCSWISSNNVKVATRRENYCKSSDTYNGSSIRNMCPLACDFCQTLVPLGTPAPTPAVTSSPTVSPTKSPIAGTITPTLSSSPTISPTRPPSPMPSPFPTLQPTSIPSKTPSEVPSIHPSDVPTKIPSKSPSDNPTMIPSKLPSEIPTLIPSDVPTQIPSAQPSDIPTKVPSNKPSGIPTNEPSDIPSKDPSFKPSQIPTVDPSEIPTNTPTESIKPSATPSAAPIGPPTASPTASPVLSVTASPTATPTATTTASPTAPTACVDDPTFTFTLINNASIIQNCEWITKNDIKTPTRIDNYCTQTEIKFTGCPATCGGCTCLDDPTFTFPMIVDPTRSQPCSWITQNGSKELTRKSNYCPTVEASCPEACGLCA